MENNLKNPDPSADILPESLQESAEVDSTADSMLATASDSEISVPESSTDTPESLAPEPPAPASPPLHKQPTYVFIDASNISMACFKTLGFKLDFVRLLRYLRHKYHHLQDLRYYEGIAKDDEPRRHYFDFLARWGYTVCALERKSYQAVDHFRQDVTCPECGHQWPAVFVRDHTALKSNVDVYLATDLLAVANDATRPTHIILLTCDGDYSEMIRSAIERNPNISITVMATPPVRDKLKNSLSVRLRNLRRDLPRYYLTNITDIKDNIRKTYDPHRGKKRSNGSKRSNS